MKVIDIVSSLVSREAYDANWLSPAIHQCSDIALSTAQCFATFASAQWTIIESRNKLTVFHYFRNPNTIIAQLEPGQLPWAVYVTEISKLDPFIAIWLLEGRAAWLVDQHTCLDESLLELSLATKSVGPMAASRFPLYTGAGITFARKIFDDSQGKLGPIDLCAFVERVGAIAERAATAKYQVCLHEAMGLVTQTLHPELISGLSQKLSQHHEQLFSLFWHGVGRGLYFNPLHLLPGMPLRHWSLDASIASTPNTCACRNLLAGFFWAFTLVNIRHPEVVTFFLGSRSIDHWKPHAAAISNGVSAALLLWRHLTVNDSVSEHFLGHVPSRATDGLRRLWQDRIVSFSRWRLTHEYERIRRDDRIADIFHFHEQ